jgi:lysophospholipase L1-like esterase
MAPRTPPPKALFALIVAATVLGVAEGLARVVIGPPVPQLVAHMPDGRTPLIRRTEASLEPLYQHTRAAGPIPLKATGSKRVVWLGGSSIHGGTFDITAWQEAPGRMGQILGLESINLGGVGMDTVTITAVLDDVIALGPDAVVLYTGHNDLGNAVFTGRYAGTEQAATAQLRAILGSSRLFQWLETRVREREVFVMVSPETEGQFTVSEATRSTIHERFEERLRHIVFKLSRADIIVVMMTVISNPLAPSMEFSCPEALKMIGFPTARPEAWPVDGIATEALAQAETVAPGCRDLAWLRARLEADREAAVAALDALRDADPLPVRADRQMNEIIRSVAKEAGVLLVDADRAARTLGGGVEPTAWFVDLMHLTVPGHDALAIMAALKVASALDLPRPEIAVLPPPVAPFTACGTEACRR